MGAGHHVLREEVKELWVVLKPGDTLVLYQHKTNKNNKEWVGPKKEQFESAIEADEGTVKIAHGFEIVSDVVFFYKNKELKTFQR